MLTITIPRVEYYDETKGLFFTVEDTTISLEHSLLSLSKWESKHQKPFLGVGKKTPEEVLDYVRAMILTPGITSEDFSRLSQDNIDQINAYIESPQSATTFGEMPKQRGRGETITSELIYFWMVSYNIPFACENWHLNRLFSLVRICNMKNNKPKKMSRTELAQRNRDLNAKRKAEMGTTG